MKNEFKVIADLIEKDKRVLDVGCADGTLMKFLKDNKNINIRGLEISKDKVQKCIAKGLTVIEGNAEKDLSQFPDKSFDYVILSQTLQAFLNPELVINELLRVGKKAIVTIPNFGYWKIRLHLLTKGTMPITKTLPDEWYNTPNLHMCTIKDFVHFVKSRNFRIFKSLALNNEDVSLINNSNLGIKNLFADLGIFLIEKDKRVLDVGCADGTLMKFLKDNKNINIRGLEISKDKVQKCIAKGLTVIEGNAEKDLSQFPDKSFDYVVLSQTLQAFLNPELVINELLRVGNKAIVTIPNFGYWKIRLHLLTKGTMPITKTLPDEWYNTPNLHMCTIKDFVHFVKSRNFKIFKSLALNNEDVSLINNSNLGIKNLFADLGIFLIEK